MTESRSELIRAVRESGEDALRRLRAAPPSVFDAGRYENGWNGKQILAHLAAIEWTYPRLIDLPATAAPGDEGGRIGRDARVGVQDRMDDYNARQVAKRAGATVQELLDEFARNREATLQAIGAADAAVFERPVQSFGGARGTLGEVVRAVVVGHVEGHVRDLLGG